MKSYGHSQGSVHRCRIYLSLQDIGAFGEQLPALAVLNLSNNLMSKEVTGLPQLKSIRILVLNCTGVNWMQVGYLPSPSPPFFSFFFFWDSFFWKWLVLHL